LKLTQLKTHFIKDLSGIYPETEAHSFFSILAEEYLKFTRFQVSVNRDSEVSEINIEKFFKALEKLKIFEPIQYIIGKTEFFSLPFFVNQHTLIPRPETEELVDLIIKNKKRAAHNSPMPTILDIGTGSGCIAISLAKNLPNSNVSALDFSEEAIKIARKNAALNNVEVDFFLKDILSAENLPRQYDAIVSNPPYVREVEKKMMQQNVLGHEPHSALFVSDQDPLLFYRKISQIAITSLKPNGWLYFEINEYLSVEMHQLLSDLGFTEIEITNDIFEKPRMLQCRLK